MTSPSPVQPGSTHGGWSVPSWHDMPCLHGVACMRIQKVWQQTNRPKRRPVRCTCGPGCALHVYFQRFQDPEAPDYIVPSCSQVALDYHERVLNHLRHTTGMHRGPIVSSRRRWRNAAYSRQSHLQLRPCWVNTC